VNISRLTLQDAWLIESERICDERGFFSRIWCRDEFVDAGLPTEFVQASQSNTRRKGSIRGMHFQFPPSKEGKLIRCVNGAIYDVVVDVRPDSRSFLQYQAVELSADNGAAVFIPSGFAHGFQTLTDSVDVFYEMTDVYRPDLAGGFRYNDPAIDIHWPLDVTVLSRRDSSYPDIEPGEFTRFASEDQQGS
jgi:dTDP-4-dehydrorhamnose 3,5-epimerase